MGIAGATGVGAMATIPAWGFKVASAEEINKQCDDDDIGNDESGDDDSR